MPDLPLYMRHLIAVGNVALTAEEEACDEPIARDGLFAKLVKRQRVDVDGR